MRGFIFQVLIWIISALVIFGVFSYIAPDNPLSTDSIVLLIIIDLILAIIFIISLCLLAKERDLPTILGAILLIPTALLVYSMLGKIYALYN